MQNLTAYLYNLKDALSDPKKRTMVELEVSEYNYCHSFWTRLKDVKSRNQRLSKIRGSILGPLLSSFTEIMSAMN